MCIATRIKLLVFAEIPFKIITSCGGKILCVCFELDVWNSHVYIVKISCCIRLQLRLALVGDFCCRLSSTFALTDFHLLLPWHYTCQVACACAGRAVVWDGFRFWVLLTDTGSSDPCSVFSWIYTWMFEAPF